LPSKQQEGKKQRKNLAPRNAQQRPDATLAAAPSLAFGEAETYCSKHREKIRA